MGRGRKPLIGDKGVHLSIYLRDSQVKWLDEQVKKRGITRSKFVEEKVFPPELQVIAVVRK